MIRRNLGWIDNPIPIQIFPIHSNQLGWCLGNEKGHKLLRELFIKSENP